MEINREYRLALITGGRGYERYVSLMGGENLRPKIEKSFRTLNIVIEKDGRWLFQGEEIFPFFLSGEGGFYSKNQDVLYVVGCAFPLLHGDFGEDGIVQGALENARIPYVGCDVHAGAVCRDKAVVKAIAKSLGIPTLPYVTLTQGDNIEAKASELSFPIFVKPRRLGSSMGAGVAGDMAELRERVNEAFVLSPYLMLEPYLKEKTELELSYLSASGREILTHPGQIVTDGFYDYKTKYAISAAGTEAVARISPTIAEKIREYARKIIDFVPIRQICRVDFFLFGERIYLNEINTMPGMTKTSLYEAMLKRVGISGEEMAELLIREAMLP